MIAARIPSWLIVLAIVLVIVFLLNALGIVKLHGSLAF